ncbi:MAG: ATP-dependent DNA helicase [Nanoarchaeota archaeon]
MQTLLKTYFGYDSFRPNQKEAMESVLNGKDTFVLMPTGGGKSLCYQLPALKLKGLTLVVSPLIALMKDQVDSLKTNGISAEFINSSLSYQEILAIQMRIHLGEIKILYVAPERFSQQSFLELRNIFPKIPIIALTATATEKVRKDIINQLSLRDANTFISSFNRENLIIKIMRTKDSFQKILKLLQEHKDESVIIYCFSRKETEKIAIDLNEHGYKAIFYHAGLEDNIRKKNQELFIKDKVNIIVATIAFGMGIDKPNVRLVIHHTFPKTLEGYYQEIGRAGRDGLKSECVLFYSIADERKHNYFLDKLENPDIKEKRKSKLNQVIKYAESKKCRKKQILDYFGEIFSKYKCNSCVICLAQKKKIEITNIAKDILSAISLTKGFFGANYIIKLLHGYKTTKDWHKKFYFFGKLQDISKEDLKEIIHDLISIKFIKKSSSQFPTLSLTFKGINFLDNPYKIEMEKIIKPSIKKQKRLQKREFDYDKELFEKLRKLRKEIAEKRGVPPFIVFGDETLREMAHFIPKTKEDLLKVKGVGEAKIVFFGNQFLELLRNYSL